MADSSSGRLITRSSIEILRTSRDDPDSIDIEAWLGRTQLLSITFEESDRRSIHVSFPDEIELDAKDFQGLINQAMLDLDRWEADLREPGGIWSPGGLWTKSPE